MKSLKHLFAVESENAYKWLIYELTVKPHEFLHCFVFQMRALITMVTPDLIISVNQSEGEVNKSVQKLKFLFKFFLKF